jgi:hypothetical protein
MIRGLGYIAALFIYPIVNALVDMSSFRTNVTLRTKVEQRQKHRVIIGKPLSAPSTSLSQVLSKNDTLKNVFKKQYEIIITRFNETLEWTKGIEHLCTVYNKGAPIEFAGTVIDVPNYGLNLETILRHIILNYDNLSDVTMMGQGRLVDRSDQPMYPLAEYYTQCSANSIFGNATSAYDPPSWREFSPKYAEDFKCVNNRTLSEFRKDIVKIPYRSGYEKWVPGAWISIGRNCILNKGLDYYKGLYEKCIFHRALRTEEIWFLERSIFTIFTSPIGA